MILAVIAAFAGAAAVGLADPEGVVATAPVGSEAPRPDAIAPAAVDPSSAVTGSGGAITQDSLTTAEQIDRWIDARAPDARPFADADMSDAEAQPRKIHGQVGAAIGTNDFRAYDASVWIPVGETAWLGLSYSESRNDPYAYGYGDYGRGGYGAYGQDAYGYGAPSRSRSFSLSADFSSDDKRDDRPRRDRDPADRLDAYRIR